MEERPRKRLKRGSQQPTSSGRRFVASQRPGLRIGLTRRMAKAIREELFKEADKKISDLNKVGVAQGRTDINEPERQHSPNLFNVEEYEDWIQDAEPYAIDKRQNTKRFARNKIDIADILKKVATRDGHMKKCRHVIFLAAAGMGKTTLLRRIAKEGREGKYEMLKDKLIIMLDFRVFSPEEKLHPSQALLGSMFPNLDSEQLKEKYQWFVENPETIAYVIDSLDTLPFDLDKERQRIGYDESATADVIFHNLLAGDLFRDSIIISSSREYKVRNMHPSVRPDRCILLDGLPEESVYDLIDGFVGKSKGKEIKEHIKNECPDVGPLLQMPAFLVFFTISSVSPGFKPKTMSGILIKLFQGLINSPHAHVKNILIVLEKLMPLALEGIRKGIVLFTPEDLKRFNLTPEEVTDLGILIPHSSPNYLFSKLMQKEGFFLYFNHQTQQECLAALQVLSMELETLKTFIQTLFQPNLSIVRRMVCGTLLNSEVLEAAKKFVKILDINQKKSILLQSLHTELINAEREKLLELLIDLNEGKDITTQFIQSSVKKIVLEGVSLTPSDVQAVASGMKQCKHLKMVDLGRCNLTEEKMEILTQTLLQSNLRIDCLYIGGNNLGVKGIAQLAKLSKHCQTESLRVHHCRLSSEHLEAFLKDSSGLKYKKFNVGGNKKLGPDGFYCLGKLVKSHAVEVLKSRECRIGAEHIHRLSQGLGAAKFKEFNVGANKELGPDGFHRLGKLVQDHNIEALTADYCNADSQHIQKLTEGLGGAKFKAFNIGWNPKLGPDGFHRIGKLVQDHQVKKLIADECKIDSEHIQQLSQGLGSARVDYLDLEGTYNRQHYLASLLDLLYHVEVELNLRGWKIEKSEQQKLQNKLNLIDSPTLRIKLGKYEDILLKASPSDTTLEPHVSQDPRDEEGATGGIGENLALAISAKSLTSQYQNQQGGLAVEIRENLARPISVAKVIGTDGGQVEVQGCMLKFPQNAFKKDVTVSLTARFGTQDGDIPDGCRAISPELRCNTSGVQFKHPATMKLPIYCRNVSDTAVIMCKKKTGGVWEESEYEYEEKDGFLIFEVAHLCFWRVWMRKFFKWPFPITVKAENHLYFKQSDAQLHICGITCVANQVIRNECIETLSRRGYEPAKELRDNIKLKEDETMSYKLQVTDSPNSCIEPMDDVKYTGKDISSNTFISAEFEVKPPPAPGINILRVRYTLNTPNASPKPSVLGLLCQKDFRIPANREENLTDAVPNVYVVPSERNAYQNHLDDVRAYRIHEDRQKGRVLIINNRFQGTEGEREGSEVDVRNLQRLWRDLGFEVIATPNLTAQQMLDSCELFARNTENVSAVVVIIMSHGGKANGKEYVVGEDDQRLLVENIISLFNSVRSRHLQGIPKVFMFQACRGDGVEYPWDEDVADTKVEGELHVQRRADMLITFPTQSGYTSIRNTRYGSWFINAVTRVFMEHAHDKHVLDMLTMVNGAVARKIGRDGSIQISNQESYLQKNLFLYPGWPR